MRIAIITQPLRYNYGGILQNYALQQVLKGMGHEVTTLEITTIPKSLKKQIVTVLKWLFFACVDENGRFLHIWSNLSSEQTLSKNTLGFIKRHIDITRRIGLPKEGSYDAFVVGSDQVWRPMYSKLDIAYLDFAKNWKNIKRVAYAASFGSDEWEYSKQQTEKYKELVSLFDRVSVREKSGVELCQKYLTVAATHVLDPTLLLDKELYLKILPEKSAKQDNNRLFYYLLDETNEKKHFVERIASEKGICAFTVNSQVEDVSAPLSERVQPPVEDWIRGFRDAKFVITDSFHGTVFSLIFNKPFVVIGNSKRGMTRFESLLMMVKQQFRLIATKEILQLDIEKYSELPNVDLSGARAVSLSYLANSLKNNIWE